MALSAVHAVGEEMESAGLLVEYEHPDEVKRFVGYHPQKSPACLMPPQERLGLLDAALEELLQHDVVHPPALRTVVAIYVWIMLLWRPGLSACFYVYKFPRCAVKQGRMWYRCGRA